MLVVLHVNDLGCTKGFVLRGICCVGVCVCVCVCVCRHVMTLTFKEDDVVELTTVEVQMFLNLKLAESSRLSFCLLEASSEPGWTVGPSLWSDGERI